jgi:hypothetical protein
MLAPYHEVQRHKLMPFHMTTIVLPCKAGQTCVQNRVLGKEIDKSHKLSDHDLMKLTIFITWSNILENTRQSLGNSGFEINKAVIKSCFWIHFHSERKLNHEHLTNTVHSFQTAKKNSCEKTENLYRRMQKKNSSWWELYSANFLSVAACYCLDWLEKYFNQKRLIIDSSFNHIKNCMYISNNERGELQRNTDKIKLKKLHGLIQTQILKTIKQSARWEVLFYPSSFVCKDTDLYYSN